MSTPLSRTVTVRSEQGLHLRPANALVELANRFESNVQIGKGGELFDCKSILSLMTLGAAQGTELMIEVDGADAQQAVQAIESFFESGFETPNENEGAESAVDS